MLPLRHPARNPAGGGPPSGGARRGEREGAPARTIVAVPGWGQPQDVALAGEAGFDRHLVKPVDVQALVQVISARVDGAARAAGRMDCGTGPA